MWLSASFGWLLFWSPSHQRAACKQKYRYSRYSCVGLRCFSSKNTSGSPVVEHYWILNDHVRCTWDKNMKDDFGDDDKRNPIKLCLASASLHQHRSPAAVLLWLWRKQQIRGTSKTEMDHAVWQSSYYILGISGCSYERAVLAPLPGAIGACIIRCEKAWHWCLVARNWPHILLQSIL